jgi:transglutaminase-like putative cysteine protease
MPVPQTNEHQKVAEIRRKIPAEATVAKEPKYGNRILHFETEAPDSGELEFEISYQVERQEIRGLKPDEQSVGPGKSEIFLTANAKVPIDGRPLVLLNGLTLPAAPLELGRTLFNLVDDHMRYDKSKPGYGNGDVLWACDSRFGNCTDFHSLFISLARSQDLPARFEIGFSLPEERGAGTIDGYHCWASFFVNDHGWVPTDISEADKHPEMKEYYFANLTENRITFTVGRDLQLTPKQSGRPLNFFVYPYVEVDGKPWPIEKSDMRFGYKDL